MLADNWRGQSTAPNSAARWVPSPRPSALPRSAPCDKSVTDSDVGWPSGVSNRLSSTSTVPHAATA
jgi:hypothetical protein